MTRPTDACYDGERANFASCGGVEHAWLKSYPNGKGWDTPIPISTVVAQFDAATDRNADRCAIEFRDHRISYRKLRDSVDRFAAALLADGVGPGSSVALYLPNTPYHPIAFYAVLKTGAKVVHLSPLDAERTLKHKLADSGARLLITTDAGLLLPMALRLLEAGALDGVIVGEDAIWGGDGIERAAIPASPCVQRLSVMSKNARPVIDWPRVEPEHIALLQYTGGTTGMPKGAILTHANLTAAVGMYDAWFRLQNVGTPGQDRIIGVLPLFHIYALTTILLRQIGNGNTILLHMRFDPEAILHDIEVKRATQFPGVPTMWIALANHPGIETRDLSSLKQALSGGASLPVEIASRFKHLTGLTLRGGWGMTETSPAGTRIPETCEDKPGTIGIPMPGVDLQVVSLFDPRKILGVGEVGELRVKGANVTPGYWQRPEETAEVFTDGYLLTGDIGYMDEDGYFFIVDRKKDMIISGGYNVYPQMIEQAIYEHPAISEVLVVGISDPYRGEAAKAFIALRNGHASFTLDELRAFLKSRLGPHELPSALEFREALPRTPVGKLSKLELLNELRHTQAGRAEKPELKRGKEHLNA